MPHSVDVTPQMQDCMTAGEMLLNATTTSHSKTRLIASLTGQCQADHSLPSVRPRRRPHCMPQHMLRYSVRWA